MKTMAISKVGLCAVLLALAVTLPGCDRKQRLAEQAAAQAAEDRCAQRSQARGVNPDVWVHGTPRGRASITCSSKTLTRGSG